MDSKKEAKTKALALAVEMVGQEKTVNISDWKSGCMWQVNYSDDDSMGEFQTSSFEYETPPPGNVEMLLFTGAAEVLAFHAQKCKCKLDENGETVVNDSIKAVFDARNMSSYYRGMNKNDN